jgi:SLAP domain-containing protein
MLRDKFKISYSPEEENIISSLSESMYYEQLDTIKDFPENSVFFHTLYVYEHEEVLEVKVFIINSTNKNANFQFVPLILVDETGKNICGAIMNLSNVGEIPSMNIRPHTIYFNKEDIKNAYNTNNCKVIIDNNNILINQSHKMKIDYIDYKIPSYEKMEIEKYIENMSAVKQNDVKLRVYKSTTDDEGKPYIILSLINGMDIKVNVSKFKLVYKDKMGSIRAVKVLEVLPEVKPKSASFFKYFIEPEEIIRKPFDPDKCKVAIEA